MGWRNETPQQGRDVVAYGNPISAMRARLALIDAGARSLGRSEQVDRRAGEVKLLRGERRRRDGAVCLAPVTDRHGEKS